MIERKTLEDGTVVEMLTDDDARWDLTGEELEMDPPADSVALLARELQARGIDAVEMNTGGNCMVVEVRLQDGSYLWASDMDGPWLIGHYVTSDEDMPARGFLPGFGLDDGVVYDEHAVANVIERKLWAQR